MDLDPETAKLIGIETMNYRNNSPDTLHEIYFHLFFNAFQPGSYLDLEERKAGYYDIAEVSKRAMGFVNIDVIKIDDLRITDYFIDNTIMRVPLAEPLQPGETAVIYIEFASQIPARGSRTARAGRHFDVGQWYPKPVVYDRYGWHLHQYVDYEFYAEFGNFHVELTIPSEFIVAHMGKLLNEEEIYGSRLPVPEGDSILMDALKGFGKEEDEAVDSVDMESEQGEPDEFSDEYRTVSDNSEDRDGVPDEPDTVKSDTELKTWIFEANNIHDFAFCADPRFVLDICRYKDVTIKAYYTEPNKNVWQRDAAKFARRAIEYFSEIYIPYPYEQYSVVSSLTGGGMEYPQLTMISRRYGSRGKQYLNFDSVIAHEVGHAWFYGILGFNETEQACLDEGLTTFSCIRYMERFYGRRHNNFRYKHGWQRALLPNGDERNDNQKTYLRRALRKDEDPMLTPANRFKDGGRYYNAVYEKAASVYLMLQYVMGDHKFETFMKTLCERWAYRHPYLSDVQQIAEEVYGAKLDWFFDQWFNTTWRLDYALSSVKSENTSKEGRPGYNTTFSVTKNQRCVSPLDIVLYYGKDVTDTVNISQAVWLDGQDRYDTTVFLRARPKKAVINPDRRLADIDMLNNSTGIPKIQWQFMVPRFLYEDNYIEHYVESYTVAHRPLLWYNSIDGIKPGYRFNGSYLGVSHNIDLQSWVGLNNSRLNYVAGYSGPLYAINPGSDFHLNSREIEGRGEQRAGAYFPGDDGGFGVNMRRYYVYDPDYIYGDNWSPGETYSLDASLSRRHTYRFSRMEYRLSAVTSIWGSDYDFSRLFGQFEYELLDILGNNTRFRLQLGIAKGDVPAERRFYLSSSDPLETWNSPLYRSKGTLPDDWKDRGRLFMPGGGGLYGYYKLGISGNRILTGRLERDLPPIKSPFYIPVLSRELRRVSPQLYVASGLIWNNSDDFEPRDFVHEAGLAFSYEIPYLNYFMDEARLRLYLPLWLSDPIGDNDKFDFRWIVGITP